MNPSIYWTGIWCSGSTEAFGAFSFSSILNIPTKQFGEVAEWSIAVVLKTTSALNPTKVRIFPSPPMRD